MQAEPAGISAYSAKSLPSDKLVWVVLSWCKQFVTWDVSCQLCGQAVLHVSVQRCGACREWLPTCSCIAAAWHTGLQQPKCCTSASEKSSVVCRLLWNLNDNVRGSYLSSPFPSVVQNRACGCWCVLAKHASRTLSESDRGTTCSIVRLHYVFVFQVSHTQNVLPCLLSLHPFTCAKAPPASNILHGSIHSVESKNA